MCPMVGAIHFSLSLSNSRPCPPGLRVGRAANATVRSRPQRNNCGGRSWGDPWIVTGPELAECVADRLGIQAEVCPGASLRGVHCRCFRTTNQVQWLATHVRLLGSSCGRPATSSAYLHSRPVPRVSGLPNRLARRGQWSRL